jgi:hypothetical protein
MNVCLWNSVAVVDKLARSKQIAGVALQILRAKGVPLQNTAVR